MLEREIDYSEEFEEWWVTKGVTSISGTAGSPLMIEAFKQVAWDAWTKQQESIDLLKDECDRIWASVHLDGDEGEIPMGEDSDYDRLMGWED